MTFREYRTRIAWLDKEWNHPSRTDNYLMQIAMEVVRQWSKNKSAYNLSHFKLKFGSEAKERPKKITSQQAETVKRGWLSSVFGRKRSGD